MAEKLKTQLQISCDLMSQIKKNIKNIKAFQAELEKNKGTNISLLLSALLFGALSLEASDIHLEVEANQTKVRLRLDGALFDAGVLAKETYLQALNRLKLFSSVKLNITQKPQDGRFAILAGKTEIEIRTSTLPSEFGETIVMRLLNPKNLISLNELGLRDDMARILKEEIKKPNGMIISTGPTGSGKTTSLYGILKTINASDIKIITIENPIEYRLAGVSQSQVDETKGYDFATGLATIVRQDPDVILVGEIRDQQTANIAIQAAMTGHLVLTTLHTNDAAGTISRLQALGEKAENIAPALNLVIAQRLLRKVCPQCAKEKNLSLEEATFINKNLENLFKKGICEKVTEKTKVLTAQGCESCNQIGYKGRIGVYEFLLVDDEMENFINKGPSIVNLKAEAKRKGMTTMLQDGLIKTLKRITTLKEVSKEVGKE
ncbi:hypothetical protein COX24_02330 [bacterium (Candidatus Gribaldobacteria) CG23_combo_of_CG06-09_8_20_14_all_37_87_8]|uniref:Bacterial type II secretion system protein E domain-containing protein n=2 Tax=Candidatus Gribaldobacteria TaxID=2798536 RepID=A0A2G9ZEY5_9BACT|nr:MAG: hypothetical protein AUJ25_00695 [Parcubacteria group bacterium CG1_02_37_13]PIP31671.1 MAG: hypothetical protein COX24_02330 [bacterium (Candidatus Gribaldobacteria) CG23_combo_of_CG06-09_8_20_14_all_37_87_8]PIR89963.1 MAG: hypothetical protein COU05_03615 [bacterium (Candidatus Gribaldobacteria) CG10_big_fil_rev_8_21_14_0_10_37_21]